jgi:selenobiotic family peptide radical SAM maturase
MDQARKVLDNFYAFCKANNVDGHVCLTGGNPFMHPEFFRIYEEIVFRRFATSILGNPVPSKALKRLNEIQKPTYYQVSLEGLREYNDYIRGKGTFYKVIEFLGLLREYKITSAVMLTLNKDNMDQILPLAEKLRGHADQFTYNRLSVVGSGVNLMLPGPQEYNAFMDDYLEARKTNPMMGLKDNLLNTKLYEKNKRTFGGCTGYGCGAAFSFLALLPDGEVHACRKFPSYLGNIFSEDLYNIYYSKEAQAYREGCFECMYCPIRSQCGGCLAISYSYKQNIFSQKDPHCMFRYQ